MTLDRGSADRRAALASTTHSINRIDLSFGTEKAFRRFFRGDPSASMISPQQPWRWTKRCHLRLYHLYSFIVLIHLSQIY
jgi:hypothetical protein